MAVFSYIFGLLIACLSYIVYHKYVNVYPSLVKKPDKRYDYIIGKFNLIGLVTKLGTRPISSFVACS